jgi:hypothetical protein
MTHSELAGPAVLVARTTPRSALKGSGDPGDKQLAHHFFHRRLSLGSQPHERTLQVTRQPELDSALRDHKNLNSIKKAEVRRSLTRSVRAPTMRRWHAKSLTLATDTPSSTATSAADFHSTKGGRRRCTLARNRQSA